MSSIPASAANNPPAAPADASAYPNASRFDRVGIIASLACAVHCLAAPFLLLLLPAAGSIWSHPAVHWVVAALVLPLACLVVLRGYRVHRRRSAVIAATLGVALVFAGLLIPIMGTQLPHTVFSRAGVALVQPAPPVSAAGATCTEACCPTIATHAEFGMTSFALPPAGLVTIIGSVLLIAAHGINLHGCHCFSRKHATAAGSCGCPTAC